MMIRTSVFACAALFLAACSDSGPNAPAEEPVLAELRVAAGNNQRAAAGSRLERPLVVEALDQFGQPLAGSKCPLRARPAPLTLRAG